MAFDAEGYRKAAKDAGLSDEEIQKDIDEETQGLAAKGADANLANVKVGQDFMGIPEWLQPAGVLATGVVLGAGALKGGQKLKERMAAPTVQSAPRVEPTFGIPDVEAAPQAQGKFTPPQGDVTDVASRPVGDPRLQIGGPRALPAPEVAVPTAAAPAPAPTAPAAPTAPVAPPAEVAPAAVAPLTDKQRREKAMADLAEHRLEEAKKASAAAEVKRTEGTVQKSQGKAFNNQDNTILANAEKIKAEKAIEAAGVTKAPKPAPAAAVAPPVAPVAPAAPVAAAPAVPPDTTSLTKEQKGMKNYLVSQYGGGPEGEAAYKKTIDILGAVPAYEKGQGGGLSKEANQVIKDWRKANIEGPKVNLTHDMKKVMKGAGGAGILMALPGFAEAAQRKDMGKMSDIFTDFFVLPFAQSRGLNENEDQELAKRRYEGAVGGGRGIAPPSAYQR